MTLAIPNELHKKMKQMSEIRWSEVARKAIQQRIEDLEVMNKIACKSKLTKKDAEEIAKKIDSAVAKKLRVTSSHTLKCGASKTKFTFP